MTTRFMKTFIAGSLGLVLTLALAACGADDPTATPVPPAAPTEAADPFVAEWDALVAAAQAEGELSTFGFDEDAQEGLLAVFEEKFGITIINSDGSGRQQAERALAERDAGQYTLDVWIGGTGTPTRTLIPEGLLQAIPPLLFHPEVLDTSAWLNGKLAYIDTPGRKFIFGYSGGAAYEQIGYNTDLVPDITVIKSFYDLLNPEWKGKIVANDPRVGGSAAHTTFYYMHKDLGPEFLTSLLTETDIVFAPDGRTAAEWLAQGQYSLCLWACGREIRSAKRDGLPVEDAHPGPLKEAGDIRIGSGALIVLDKNPNPSAMKLFINWFLSKEGQTVFQKASESNSLRIDIPKDDVREGARLDPSLEYLFLAMEDDFAEQETAAGDLAQQVLDAAGR